MAASGVLGCLHCVVNGLGSFQLLVASVDGLRHSSACERIRHPADRNGYRHLWRTGCPNDGLLYGCRNALAARFSAPHSILENLVGAGSRLEGCIRADALRLSACERLLCLRNRPVLLRTRKTWLVDAVRYAGQPQHIRVLPAISFCDCSGSTGWVLGRVSLPRRTTRNSGPDRGQVWPPSHLSHRRDDTSDLHLCLGSRRLCESARVRPSGGTDYSVFNVRRSLSHLWLAAGNRAALHVRYSLDVSSTLCVVIWTRSLRADCRDSARSGTALGCPCSAPSFTTMDGNARGILERSVETA